LRCPLSVIRPLQRRRRASYLGQSPGTLHAFNSVAKRAARLGNAKKGRNARYEMQIS